VGPILGGAVVERIGFELASFGICLLMLSSVCLYFLLGNMIKFTYFFLFIKILLYGFVHLITKNTQNQLVYDQPEREPLLN